MQGSFAAFEKSAPHLADKEMKLKAGVATMRCALSREQTDAAVEAIQMLNRNFRTIRKFFTSRHTLTQTFRLEPRSNWQQQRQILPRPTR